MARTRLMQGRTDVWTASTRVVYMILEGVEE
jgi:hypothetical protein